MFARCATWWRGKSQCGRLVLTLLLPLVPASLATPGSERGEPQAPETYMLLHFPEVCAQKEGAEPQLSSLPPVSGLF